MTKYTYTKEIPCYINLLCSNENTIEFSLCKGCEYDLPENNPSVIRMVAAGDLIPVYKIKNKK